MAAENNSGLPRFVMTYRLHMLSFEHVGESGYSVAFGDGGNLQPWHLDEVEKWLAEQRAKTANDDGADLV